MRGAPRGRAHNGRTLAFGPDDSVKAAATLHPGDPARIAYEELLAMTGVSGAEVLRMALVKMRDQMKADASRQQQVRLQEAG